MESTAAGVRLSTILEMAPTAEPFSTLMHLATVAHEQSLLARHPATATFTGDGGDCVFGSFCIGEAADGVSAQARPATRGAAARRGVRSRSFGKRRGTR